MPKLLISPVAREIGERIRIYRELHGISQKELAERCGITAPQLCRYEKGTDLPSSPVLARLAAAMDRSMDCLYHGSMEEIDGKLDADLLHTFRKLHGFSEQCRRAVDESAQAHMSMEIMEKRADRPRKNGDTGVTPGKPKGRKGEWEEE